MHEQMKAEVACIRYQGVPDTLVIEALATNVKIQGLSSDSVNKLSNRCWTKKRANCVQKCIVLQIIV